jgi:hypothetical protein
VFGRKFLGDSLWAARDQVIERRVADKPLAKLKQRVRRLTRRSGGRSMRQVADGLRPCLLGWKADFGLAQTAGVWRKLDEWLRHRPRAIQLTQCGATGPLFTANCRRWEPRLELQDEWRPNAVAGGATAASASTAC